MISDLQADIDQENEPDLSKSFIFSPHKLISCYFQFWKYVHAASITFTVKALQTQQLDFLKRAATRGRIVAREAGEARTKSREDS